MGGSSCAETLITSSKATVCAGYQSCQQAEINGGGGRVDTYGYQSAAESTIKDASIVRIEAYQALLNGIIDSNGSGGGVYIFRDCEAGKGANVICRNGDTCKVKCIGKGCKGLTYQCETGATCRLEPSGCNRNSGGSYNGVRCPTLTSGTTINMDDNDKADIDDVDESELVDMDNVDPERKKKAALPETCHGAANCNACEREGQCKRDKMIGEEEAHDTYYIEAVSIIGLILLLCGITLCYRKNKKKSDGYQTLLTDDTIQV